tara:strand:+ start:123 stop:638 length:516 start_codon:yes stop_codon:yes gene_type:complete
LVTFLICVYSALGLVYLFGPSIALELGRPKDLLKGGLFFLLAIFLSIKKNSFSGYYLTILLFNNIICFILIAEINLSRWNSLSDTEKKSFKNFSVIKNKLLLFLDALKLGNKKFLDKSKRDNSFDKNVVKRVWVRSEKDNLENNNSQSPNLIVQEPEVTNLAKEDIIDDEK